MDIIGDIIRREGGFVDHPADRGGPTKYGITQATLERHRHAYIFPDDVRKLTEMEARLIYSDLYIKRPGFDRIADEKLRSLVVDCGVNHGPVRATRMLQKAVRVTVDGILGPNTMAGIDRKGPANAYLHLLAERIRFYGKLITKDPTQAVFAAGWMNRAAEFLEV